MAKKDADGQEWYVLPILFESADFTAKRHLYIKYHDKDGEQESRRVFMCGIPVGVTDEECLQFVSSFGPVQAVAMHGSRSSALIVFETDTSAQKIIQTAEKGRTKPFHRIPRKEPFGLKAWVEQHKQMYTINTNKVLQKQLDAWMEEFEEREAREKEQALAAMEDDGWTVVKRHKGRKKNVDETSGITVGAVAPAAALEVLKSRQTSGRDRKHENFYKFQQREKRRSGMLHTIVCTCYDNGMTL